MHYYLKANKHEFATYLNLCHWINALLPIEGAKLFLLCDNPEVFDYMKTHHGDFYSHVIPLSSVREESIVRDLANLTLSDKWKPAGFAHLTTFLHAMRAGCTSFWNIDADDTYMAVSPEKLREILSVAQSTAQREGIHAFSLDMHASKLLGYNWTFGINYIDNTVDWFGVMYDYADEYEGMKNVLDSMSNLDWYFGFLRKNSELRIESFYVENLRFVHYHDNMLLLAPYSGVYYWEKGRFITPILKYALEIPLIGDLPIFEDVIRLDVELTAEESIKWLQEYATVRKFSEKGSPNIDDELCQKLRPYLVDRVKSHKSRVIRVNEEKLSGYEWLLDDLDSFYLSEEKDYLQLKKSFIKYQVMSDDLKKDNSQKLSAEMLRRYHLHPKVHSYFILSAVLELTGDENAYLELIRLCREDDSLTKENRYYAYRQLIRYKFLNARLNTERVREALDDLYDSFYEEYSRSIGISYGHILKNERNKDFVVVLTSQLLGLAHGPTKTLFDRCEVLTDVMGKKLYIINTADVLPSYGEIPWFNPSVGSYADELSSMESVRYKDRVYPFFQCPREMPDAAVISEILKFISEEKPYYVVAIGGNNITADLCSRMVPVLSVTLNPAERTDTRCTFQMTGHKTKDEDVRWLRKHGFPDDHIILGTFTSSFKEQVHSYKRTDLGLPENGVICLVVGGRLDSEIDEDFITFISKLAEKGIYTAFMGKFNRYDSVCEKSEALKKHLINLGFQDDPLAVCECCDIYINPKRLGGGTSAAEALSKGLPALTLNYGDVMAGVGEDFCFDSYDEIFEEILKLADDKMYYEEIKQKALKRAGQLTDSAGEFSRILTEMEGRESFW